jgi:hypothetical protein
MHRSSRQERLKLKPWRLLTIRSGKLFEKDDQLGGCDRLNKSLAKAFNRPKAFEMARVRKTRRRFLGTSHLTSLRELREAGGAITLRGDGDHKVYFDLQSAGCIEVVPLFLSDIRCEITERGRQVLLQYGVRPAN